MITVDVFLRSIEKRKKDKHEIVTGGKQVDKPVRSQDKNMSVVARERDGHGAMLAHKALWGSDG